MSFRAKRELLVQVAPRYRAARHGQRSVILDEFVAVTGYDRKYAIRLLLGPVEPPKPIQRPRAAQYGVEVQQALVGAWTAANGICGKRLVPFLPELIPTLERHGHLSLSNDVRRQVLSLSPATADRLLKSVRQPHGLATPSQAGCSSSTSRCARSPSGPTSIQASWKLTWSPTVAAAWAVRSCTRSH